jgi:intracellular sulfur oxidation DsrE/DsrF family protein
MTNKDTVFLVTNNGMGKGPEDLQLKLISNFMQLLDQSHDLPAAICFYTEGVKLVVDGSPILDPLLALEKKEVRLIACSTCLDYFRLIDKIRAGIVGSMADILEAQLKAGKVISL